MANIMFFSVSAGSGHNIAAKAVIEEINRSYPSWRTRIVDTLKFINPVLNKIAVGGYMKSLEMSPKIWGNIYRLLEFDDHSLDVCQVLSHLSATKFTKAIERFAPDAIICTHPVPARILSILKAKDLVQVPLIAVITDYTVHHYWIHNNIDTYVVPCEELSNSLIQFGVKQENILPVGIPLRPQFASKFTKSEAQQKLGLQQAPTILVMGGGEGLGEIEEIVQKLADSDLDIQILCVTGKNEKLKEHLTSMDTHGKVKIFGFVKDIAALMTAADLVVTKPGGVTSAEVLSQGLPMIVVNPIPGQEERNTEFLVSNSVAIRINSISHLPEEIRKLLTDHSTVNKMKEEAYRLSKPNSSSTLVHFIAEQIEKGHRQQNQAIEPFPKPFVSQ